MTEQRSEAGHWSGTGQLRGGRWGIWFFITALKLLGLRMTYMLSVPAAIYFSFVSPDVPATMDYHRRIFGQMPWWRRRWLVFRHFLSFGRALIDRLAILANQTRKYSFVFDGENYLREAVAEGKGVLLLTAHLGNWELAGRLLSTYGRRIHVLMAPEQDPAIQRFLRKGMGDADIRFVTNEGGAVFVQLLMALRRGEVVAVQMDRATGHRSDVSVPFFGAPAVFPLGPLLLARAAQVPVLPCFCVMRPDARYEIWVDQALTIAPGHEEAALRQMVRVLERYIAMVPNQWYNFYDVWNPIPTA